MQKTRSFIVIETLIMFLLVTTIPLWLHFFSSEDPSGKISVDIDRKVIEEPKELEEPKKEEMPIELPISEEEPTSIIIIEEPINDLPIEDVEEPYEIEIEEPSPPIEEEDDINAREEEEEPSIPPEEDETKKEQDVEAPEDFRIIIGGGGSGGDSFNIVANAGKDFSVYENDIVTLNGFLSPGAVSYLWTCEMDEKPVLIPNANSRIASFRAPLLTEDKEINCTLKVSDLFDPSISKEDGVKINIINGPIVNVGQDKVVNEAETVNLVSSCKGAGLLYNWQCDHKDVILRNKNESIASFSAPFVDKDESFTCRLTVRDLGGEIKVDELNVLIRNGPVAISQGDIVVIEGGTINLSASNSIGAIASYAWSCDNNFPAINTNLENYSLSAPSVTENTLHNCTLNITDILEETSTTTFTITVLKELAKKPRVYFNPYTRYITEGTEVTLSPVVESTAPVFDYSWSCTFNGNPLNLSNTSSKNPTFIASSVNDDDQKVLCTVTATNEGGSSSATQILKIINGPVASTGSNQTTQENRLVTLNGSYRGNIKEVNWICDNDIILTNANTLRPSFTTPFVDSDTLITCTLTITDFEDKVDSNTTSITILNGPKAISSNIAVRENKIGTFVNSSIGDLVSYNFTCPDRIVSTFMCL